MKAELIFDLPEENIDLLRAAKAVDLALALWETNQLFYNHGKFDGQGDEFFAILEKYDINLDVLVE